MKKSIIFLFTIIFLVAGCTKEGPQGPQGPQGEQGEQGSMGPGGETGAQGQKGDTGAQGQRGETGSQGPKGDAGPQGPRGFQGPKGDTGPQGPMGPQGPKSVEMITKTFYITSDNWTYVSSTNAYNNTYQASAIWTELTSDYYNNGLIVFYCISEYSKGKQVSGYSVLPFTFWPTYNNNYYRRFAAEPGSGVSGKNNAVDKVTFVSYDSNNYAVNPGYAIFKGVAIKNIPGVARMSPQQKDRIARQYLGKISN